MANEKTYIVALDEYMGCEPDMYEFKGTYRQLLTHLIGDDTDEFPDEPDEGLYDALQAANGDGQQFRQVWCVEDKKKVF